MKLLLIEELQSIQGAQGIYRLNVALSSLNVDSSAGTMKILYLRSSEHNYESSSNNIQNNNNEDSLSGALKNNHKYDDSDLDANRMAKSSG